MGGPRCQAAMAAAALEMVFLEGCKSGSLAAVEGALRQGCDVNCHEGWGLRRAVRYGHQGVWQLLLSHRDVQVGEASWTVISISAFAIAICPCLLFVSLLVLDLHFLAGPL